MAGTIKGITIQFNGETTKLDKALREINKETRSLDKELKQVDNALKFNPTNVELWRQKQELLTEKVDDTKKKLDALKQAQANMDTQGVDKNSKEYRELERQIIVTGNQVKTFEGQLKKIGNYKLKALSEQFKQIGGKLETAGQNMRGVSTAGAAAAGAVGALAYNGGKAADDLNTLAKVTGINTKSLQKYSAAADLVDVSVESIAKANKKLAKNAYSAANGSKSQAAAFEALGISVTDADGNLKDSEVLFQEVIAGLGAMTNETERNALAQKLMGGAAAELNPLIADGGETYKQVSDIIAQYDLDFVDQNTLDRANQFNDELDTMKILGQTAISQVSTQLASYLAPALKKVVDWIGKFAKWLGNLDPKILTIVAGIGAVLAVVSPLLIGLGKLATGISAIINLVGLLGPAIGGLSIAGGPLLLVVAAIGAVVAAGILLYKNWDKIKKTASALKTSVTSAFSALKESLVGIWDSIKTAAGTAWTAVKEKIVNPIKKAAESVSSTLMKLLERVASVWSSIKGTIKDKATSIKESMLSPFTWARDKIKEVIDKIKDFFPLSLGNFFSNIKLPHLSWEWEDIGDFVSIPVFSIDWYKKGGIFDSPTIAGIGEAGPEAVVPLDKFWDKLDNIAAASGEEITINVYASDGMDVNELALRVEQRLVQLQKQRTKAYGGI